jgi:hypothetical protein
LDAQHRDHDAGAASFIVTQQEYQQKKSEWGQSRTPADGWQCREVPLGRLMANWRMSKRVPVYGSQIGIKCPILHAN